MREGFIGDGDQSQARDTLFGCRQSWGELAEIGQCGFAADPDQCGRIRLARAI